MSDRALAFDHTYHYIGGLERSCETRLLHTSGRLHDKLHIELSAAKVEQHLICTVGVQPSLDIKLLDLYILIDRNNEFIPFLQSNRKSVGKR